MNEQNPPSKPTDTSSFASILAGVQKLRDSASKIEVTTNKTNSEPIPHITTNTPIPNPSPNNVIDLKRQRDEAAKNLVYNQAPTSFAKTSIYQQRYLKKSRINTGVKVVQKITINPSQKGNPLIKSMKNVPYEFSSIVKTDYLINGEISVIFLSLKYHKLKPNYIYERLQKIGINNEKNSNQLQILLVLLDTENNYWGSLQELTKMCVFNNFTLILSWSFEEAGEYIATIKNIDSVPTFKYRGNSDNDKFDIIKGIQKQDYYSRLVDTLTSIKSVNKTDVSKMVASGEFKNFKELIQDDGEKLKLIEGFGTVKLKRFKNSINEPFLFNKDYENDKKVLEWKKKCRDIKLQRLKEETPTNIK